MSRLRLKSLSLAVQTPAAVFFSACLIPAAAGIFIGALYMIKGLREFAPGVFAGNLEDYANAFVFICVALPPAAAVSAALGLATQACLLDRLQGGWGGPFRGLGAVWANRGRLHLLAQKIFSVNSYLTCVLVCEELGWTASCEKARALKESTPATARPDGEDGEDTLSEIWGYILAAAYLLFVVFGIGAFAEGWLGKWGVDLWEYHSLGVAMTLVILPMALALLCAPFYYVGQAGLLSAVYLWRRVEDGKADPDSLSRFFTKEDLRLK